MFGNRLKTLRKEKDLTQAQLANILKTSASAIGMYEQNRRTPDTETLQTLSNYFNVSVDYLIGKTEIRESAEQLLKDKSTTIALHNDNGIDDELPEEAKKEIEDFIKYVKHKYKKI